MVSVIIPTYNREKMIEKSIESVLKQTYLDLELIIVDDCSTDNTKSVVPAIKDNRVRYVCLEKNSGACVARNRGIELAKGDYIAFQDSDDIWLPEKLERQLETLQSQGTDITFCAFNQISVNGTQRVYPLNLESHLCTREEIVMDSLASTQTILGKASAIKDIMFDAEMPRMQDYEFIMRAIKKYNVFFLNEPLVNVYMQENSITGVGAQYEKKLKAWSLMLNKHQEEATLFPKWKVKMLKTVAHCKVMLNMDALSDLKEIYRLEKSISNYFKIMLYKIGLLKRFFAIGDKSVNRN
jgi:glycosyltransferase involved in cell wall biosynthesis